LRSFLDIKKPITASFFWIDGLVTAQNAQISNEAELHSLCEKSAVITQAKNGWIRRLAQ
jgi:DNA recombination-dependent growth factor C